LRTENEIKEMLDKLMKQIEQTKDDNPQAKKMLNQRGLTLLWVLENKKIDTLIFTEDQLAILCAVY